MSDGVQQKLAEFDRNQAVARAGTALTEADQDASSACDTPVKATVQWASIDDEKLQTLSIGGFCGEVASQLASMCKSNPDFKNTAKTLGQVQCQFGPTLKIRLQDKQVVFSTEKNASNQGEFVQQFLRNQ